MDINRMLKHIQDMTTIVTCYLNIINRPDRDNSAYLTLGRKLLACNVPVVLFMDELYIDKIEPMDHVHIIPINQASLELYAYKDQLTKFGVSTNFPEKDTMEYIILMCSKTELVRKAIEVNPFQTNHFVWVDFGIRHIFADDTTFVQGINSLHYRGDQLRIGNIWNPQFQLHDPMHIYTNIAWYFAGGVFGGKQSALLEFDFLMKQKCVELIQSTNRLMWEVNVWRLIYLEHPHLFSLYSCDHNSSLVLHYP